MLVHVRQGYADDDGFWQPLIFALIEGSKVLDEYWTFMIGRPTRLDGRCGEWGAGMTLFFAIVDLQIGRTLALILRASLLDAERQRLQAEQGLAQAQGEYTKDYVALRKTLGLGWSLPDERVAKVRR